MFTRLSNFTYGNYQIANIASAEVNTDVQFLIQIQKYEQQCLRLLLGNLLYDELMSNVELDGLYWKLKSDANEKWEWLLNGKIYEPTELVCGCESGQNQNWSGLVKKVATIQEKDVIESLMAPYVFYHWSLNYRTLNLGVGEGRSDSKSATPESSKNKRVDAWNELVQWACFGYSCTNVSLSKFLENHKAAFPNAPEISLQTMTYYDI